MREIVPIAGFNGVAPGCKATLKLPVDRLYNTLMLDATFGGSRARADVEKYIKKITLSSGGQTIRQFSAKQLNYINRINGAERFGYAGYLMIHFSKPWLATVQAEDLDALGTLGMTELTLDVELTDDAPTPKLEAFAAVEWRNRAAGAIVKQLCMSIAPAASGDVDITTLRVGPSYSRIHFFSAAVTAIEVHALGRRAWTVDRLRNNQLGICYGITQEDDVFTLAFDYTQRQSETLPTVVVDEKGNASRLQDLNLKVSVNAAGTVPFIVEIREPLF